MCGQRVSEIHDQLTLVGDFACENGIPEENRVYRSAEHIANEPRCHDAAVGSAPVDGVSQKSRCEKARDWGAGDKSSTYQRGFDLGPLVLGPLSPPTVFSVRTTPCPFFSCVRDIKPHCWF